jgi:hypothetical protein
MLKDSIDHMDMIEDAEHDGSLFAGQPIDILADDIVKAAIGPLFDRDEFGVRLTDHERFPSTVTVTMPARSRLTSALLSGSTEA